MTVRTRIFVDQGNADSFGCWWTSNNVKPGALTWDTWTSSANYAAMIDTVISDYKKRSALGELFFNPLLSLTEKCSYHPTIQAYRANMFGGEWTFHLPLRFDQIQKLNQDTSVYDLVFDPYEDEREIAISESWAKVDQSELLGLASLGELPETVLWLCTMTKRVIFLLKMWRSTKLELWAMRQLKKMTAKEYADALGNIWLELRYAVRPLIFEVKKALEALKKAIEMKGRFTARGYESTMTVGQDRLTSYNVHVSHEYTHNWTTLYSARAGVMYTIDEDINGMLAFWGLDQPVEAVWELTPLSFVFDWFFSIGKVISSWSVNASLGVLGSWVTERVSIVEEIQHSNYSLHSTYAFYAIDRLDPGFSTRERVVKRRVISPDRPLLPSMSLHLDVAKLLDLALIGKKLLA